LIGFFALVHWRNIPLVDLMSRLLGTPPFYWLGELSYGAYLLHLLILHPVAAWTIERWGHDLSAGARFGMTLGIVAPTAYGLAYLTYVLIERPGQSLGRTMLRRFVAGKQAMQTAPEEMAAP
jgi:peptidoglycan/LPS O-acetylase OafA/YrhL